MTPEEHDRYGAYSINYTHLIGRIGERIGIRETPIDTQGFIVIRDVMQYVVNDRMELFFDMQRYNPYAAEMIVHVKQALDGLCDEIGTIPRDVSRP